MLGVACSSVTGCARTEITVSAVRPCGCGSAMVWPGLRAAMRPTRGPSVSAGTCDCDTLVPVAFAFRMSITAAAEGAAWTASAAALAWSPAMRASTFWIV